LVLLGARTGTRLHAGSVVHGRTGLVVEGVPGMILPAARGIPESPPPLSDPRHDALRPRAVRGGRYRRRYLVYFQTRRPRMMLFPPPFVLVHIPLLTDVAHYLLFHRVRRRRLLPDASDWLMLLLRCWYFFRCGWQFNFLLPLMIMVRTLPSVQKLLLQLGRGGRARVLDGRPAVRPGQAVLVLEAIVLATALGRRRRGGHRSLPVKSVCDQGKAKAKAKRNCTGS